MKNITFLIITLFFCVSVNAQYDDNPSEEQKTKKEKEPKEKSEFWKNVDFGGGLGMAFNNGTYINLAPSAIYKHSKKFASGIAINGIYAKNNVYDYSALLLSPSVMGLYKPVNGLQLSVEFEENYVSNKDEITNVKDNYWYPSLYLGAGYSVAGFTAIGFRFDALFDETKSRNQGSITPFVRFFF